MRQSNLQSKWEKQDAFSLGPVVGESNSGLSSPVHPSFQFPVDRTC